jgi:hypothetical protein
MHHLLANPIESITPAIRLRFSGFAQELVFGEISHQKAPDAQLTWART